MPRSNERLQVIGEKLVPVVAYGDAAGLPTETRSASEIHQRYGRLDHLIAPRDNPYYKDVSSVGTTSDDTQLTVAVAESLIDADGFDLGVIAEKHLQAYLTTPRILNDKGLLVTPGWGRSTTSSMERLYAGVHPHESGELDGAGNGILMKMAPLAYWQVARGISPEQCHAQYDALTTMTHDSDIARSCTRLHGDVMRWLMEYPGADKSEFRAAAEMILSGDRVADPKGRIYRALHFPTATFPQLVGRYAYGPEKSGRYGFFAPNTLAMAYDVFSASSDYASGVYHAVNLGGDTDSIASIVATMYHAWTGGEFVRPTDFELVQDYDRLTVVSQHLAQKALDLS